ncbi:MAG: hypothetical protein WA139_04000 [Candidatus Aenigmatarchaeota archaeon]
MAKNHDFPFLKTSEIKAKYKADELATRGIVANKLKRKKATIGHYHPGRSVRETALIHNMVTAELAPADNPSAENILYGCEGFDDASPRKFDRAFRTDAGAVYQKGGVFMLVTDKGEAKIIKPSKDMIPFSPTMADYLKSEGRKAIYEDFL